MGIAPVPEHEGTYRARDIADAVGRERGDDRNAGIRRGEEDLREHQRRGGRVDKEVVILERGADPAAGGCHLRLVPALGFAERDVSHCELPRRTWTGRPTPGRRPGTVSRGRRHAEHSSDPPRSWVSVQPGVVALPPTFTIPQL